MLTLILVAELMHSEIPPVETVVAIHGGAEQIPLAMKLGVTIAGTLLEAEPILLVTQHSETIRVAHFEDERTHLAIKPGVTIAGTLLEAEPIPLVIQPTGMIRVTL